MRALRSCDYENNKGSNILIDFQLYMLIWFCLKNKLLDFVINFI